LNRPCQDHRNAEDAHAASQSKALKRKLIDLENHIRGSLRAYGLLVGTVGRGGYEARVRELLERCDPIFVTTIEAMLDVWRAVFEGFDSLHGMLLRWSSMIQSAVA